MPVRLASRAITSAISTSGGVLIAVKTSVFFSDDQTAESPNISRQFCRPRNSCPTPARLVLKKLFHSPEMVGQIRNTANSKRNGPTNSNPAQRSCHGFREVGTDMAGLLDRG